MISVRLGPLHDVRAEAILRPVSAVLASVTGVGREVELRSGESVRQRLAALGGLPVGGAVVTPAGDLPASYLIHVVVQSDEEPVSEAGVRRALQNGLRRAVELGMESLALPPVGTGAGNLDPEAAAAIMVPLLLEHLGTERHPREVTIVVADAYEEEVFRRTVEAARTVPPAGDGPVPGVGR